MAFQDPLSFLAGLPRIRFRRLGRGLGSVVPYLVAGLLLLLVQRSQVSETLDLLLYDLITTLRPAPSGQDTPITIIGIDEPDISRFGWPIDDRLLCEAIDRLTAGGALAVGLDLYRDQGVGPDQECLRRRFRSDPRLVSIFNAAEGIHPVPETPPDRQAFNDLVVDPDGVIRRDLVHVGGQDEATVAFPLRLLEVGLGRSELRRRLECGDAPGAWLHGKSGGYDQLDAAGWQEMLSFHTLGSFPSFSLQQVLSPSGIPSKAVKGRIVLIGSTAPSLRDLFPVPQTRFLSDSRQLQISGVEIHAHRLAVLIQRSEGRWDRGIRTLPPWGETGLEILMLVMGIVLGESFLLLRRSVLGVALMATVLVAATELLLFQYVWIGLSFPLLSLVLMAGAGWVRRGGASQQQRQQIERLLGQTTSPAVARQLWSQRDELLSDGRFEGRQLPVTVLMADICGFTTVSERMPPAALLGWLNRGMARFVPLISRSGGMVNKFTGDGLLAVFGAPLSHGEAIDARAAIDASVAIQEVVEDLNRDLAAEGAPLMRLRIGLHSGDVLAGSVGSSERLEYAVIGDAVNCAARLESLEKERQTNLCRVLVSGSTRKLIGDDTALAWLSWGAVLVKGRSEPLEIWELKGRLSPDTAPAAVPASLR